jgi:hypothetical protein
MTTFGRIISAIAVFGLMGHAAANAAPDLDGKTSGKLVAAQSDQTRLTITQVGPGEADLKFTNIAGVVLNRDVEGESFTEPDKSGKGTSHVIPGAVYEGKWLILSGVGPDWAGTGSEANSDLRFDIGTAYGRGLIAGSAATIHVRLKKDMFGTAFAAIPVIVEADGTCYAWGSYPAGQWHFIKRRNGANDMVMVLVADRNGNIRFATDTEVEAYKEFYYKNT